MAEFFSQTLLLFRYLVVSQYVYVQNGFFLKREHKTYLVLLVCFTGMQDSFFSSKKFTKNFQMLTKGFQTNLGRITKVLKKF